MINDLASGKCRNKVKKPHPSPDPWFPDSAEGYQHAKVFCLGCPVTAECLENALTGGEEHGIWGGTTPTERRRIILASRKGIAA